MICLSGNRSLPGNTGYQKVLRNINAVLSVFNLSEISFYSELRLKLDLYYS